MIHARTVFVLGAGASIPYGFPTGAQLKAVICRDAAGPDTMLYSLMRGCGFSEAELGDFCSALALSGLPSVDSFLELRQEYMEIGKVAIAAALIPLEAPERLADSSGGKDWYGYLYDHLRGRPAEFQHNLVSFLTFNYDRSLEAYLFQAFRFSYGLKDEQVAQTLGFLPIVHLYGRLGPLPWQDKTGRPYGSQVTAEVARSCAKGIRIIREAASPPVPRMSDAFRLLKDAEVICFLGFGYSPQNLARLFLVEAHQEEQEIFGSAYGLKPAERERAEALFSFGSGSPRILLAKEDEGCLDVLRTYRVIRSS